MSTHRQIIDAAIMDGLRWQGWQLANDPTTYGEDAGRWIVTTEDGEVEASCGIMSQEEAEQLASAHNDALEELWKRCMADKTSPTDTTTGEEVGMKADMEARIARGYLL